VSKRGGCPTLLPGRCFPSSRQLPQAPSRPHPAETISRACVSLLLHRSRREATILFASPNSILTRNKPCRHYLTVTRRTPGTRGRITGLFFENVHRDWNVVRWRFTSRGSEEGLEEQYCEQGGEMDRRKFLYLSGGVAGFAVHPWGGSAFGLYT